MRNKPAVEAGKIKAQAVIEKVGMKNVLDEGKNPSKPKIKNDNKNTIEKEKVDSRQVEEEQDDVIDDTVLETEVYDDMDKDEMLLKNQMEQRLI